MAPCCKQHRESIERGMHPTGVKLHSAASMSHLLLGKFYMGCFIVLLFITFCNCLIFLLDSYIQKTKKSYIDSRARRNLGSINTELQDVQRIMVANIEEVLQRGEALSGRFTQRFIHCANATDLPKFVLSPIPFFFFFFAALDSKASNLSSLSKKYRSDAKYLNTRSTYAKLAAGGVFFIMLIVYVRFWWL